MSFNNDWRAICDMETSCGSQKSTSINRPIKTNVIGYWKLYFIFANRSNGSQFDNKMRCNSHTQTNFRLIRLRLLIKMVTCLHYQFNLVALRFSFNVCFCPMSDGSYEDMLTQAKIGVRKTSFYYRLHCNMHQ